MLLFGGSWGATLALAYAIARPDNVASLVLRGIFLCRKRDLDFLYQGNASTYDPTDPYALGPPGAYILYPEAWREFVEMIDPIDRHDMIAAYQQYLATQPTTKSSCRADMVGLGGPRQLS